jgi:hypothetical protein
MRRTFAAWRPAPRAAPIPAERNTSMTGSPTPPDADRRVDVDASMDDVTVRPPRWPIVGVLSRTPLLRTGDRCEARALALAVRDVVLAAPIAGAIGTYDAAGHPHARQRHITAITVPPNAHLDHTERWPWIRAGVHLNG